PDSGGECGVPYETYFQMPTAAKDKPWYSIEQGSVHFTIISTEHDWKENSEQVREIGLLLSLVHNFVFSSMIIGIIGMCYSLLTRKSPISVMKELECYLQSVTSEPVNRRLLCTDTT